MSESASGEASGSNDANGKDFSCERCGDTFDSQTGLSNHETKSHGGPVSGKSHDCPGCDRSYSSRRGLISHLTSGCNDAGHECGECGRTHPTKRGLNHHKKETHGIETRPEVNCETCGESFYVDPNRKEQSEQHFCSADCFGEWNKPNVSGENNVRYKEPITLECEVCGEPTSGGICKACKMSKDL